MNKTIAIKLFSPYHNDCVCIPEVTWKKDTLNVIEYAARIHWPEPKLEMTFWLGQQELCDKLYTSIFDLGIKHNDWLGVGYKNNSENTDLMILDS